MSTKVASNNVLFSCVPSEGSNVCVQARCLQSGSLLKSFKGSSADERVSSICLAGTSYLLGAMVHKPFIVVWALQKEPVHTRIACSGRVEVLVCSRDGMYCAVGIQQTIHVWEVATGHLMATVSRHYQSVSALAFTDDGSHLVSGGHDNFVIVWRLARLFSHAVASGECEKHFNPSEVGHGSSGGHLTRHVWNHHTHWVTAVCCGRGGTSCRVVTASLDRTCKMYELMSGNLLFSLILDNPLTAVAMDSHETYLFLGSVEGSIVQINLFLPEVQKSSTELGRRLNGKGYKGHMKRITGLQVSGCGGVLVSSSEDGSVVRWDVKTKQSLSTVVNKQEVKGIILKYLPEGLQRKGFFNPDRLPPLKPFLKQPLFSNFLTEEVLSYLGPGQNDIAGRKSKPLPKKKPPQAPAPTPTSATKDADDIAKNMVSKVEVASIQESLAKMRDVHRKIFRFTEESLITGRTKPPPAKRGRAN